MKHHLPKLCAISLAVMAMNSVNAQSSRPSVELEEVIVTAQKRQETLQEIPISVAALSGERFDAMFSAGEDIMALSSRVPGLYAESSNGRVAPRFYIRGLGNSDFDLAASQPVSIIFDDVVQENVVLKSFPIFDVAQVEVVRGPQGTLFGRNTTAGVIKFASNKPTEEFDGYAKVSLGQLGTQNIEAAVGGTLAPDVLMGRLSILSQDRDDWVSNTFTNESDVMGGFEERAIRGQLLLTPSDSFSALLNVHSRDYDGTSSIFRANALQQGANGKLSNTFDRDTVNFNQGDNNPQEYESDGVSLKLEFDLGDISVESITAYEDASGRSKGDIDGGVQSFDFGGNPNPGAGPGFIPFDAVTEDTADVDQFTQEIRFASTTDSALQWQAGAFYFDSGLDVTSIDGFFGATTVSHENTSWSIFGQTSYDVSEALTVTGGIRYTYDEKSLVVGAQNVNGFALVTGDATIQDYDDVDVDDNEISWELSANYQLNDYSSTFARLARGFRAQSIQGRDVAFEGAPSVADSETVTSLEWGYKADLLEDTLRLNTSVFYYQIDDIQLTAVGGEGNFNRLLNADKGIGSGFEFDLEWIASDYAVFTAGGSYNHTYIDDAGLTTAVCGSNACTVTDSTVTIDGTTLANIDGNAFQNSPETVFNFTARFSLPMGDDGEVFLFTDWAYQGLTSLTLYEAKETRVDNQFEGGLRVGYINYNADYEVALFGRNITDEENIKGQIDFNNLTGFVNEPRIWGVEARYNF